MPRYSQLPRRSTAVPSSPFAACHGTQVRVKRRGDDRKHTARVLAIGVECDMALLTVDEPEFWEGVRAVRFGPLPRLHVLRPPLCMCAFAPLPA